MPALGLRVLGSEGLYGYEHYLCLLVQRIIPTSSATGFIRVSPLDLSVCPVAFNYIRGRCQPQMCMPYQVVCRFACLHAACRHVGERASSVPEMGMQVMQVKTCNLLQQPDIVCHVSPRRYGWESMANMRWGLT